MPRLKLHFALALSALLHAVLLAWPRPPAPAAAAPLRLQARLLAAPAAPGAPVEAPPAEPLLKDTRSDAAAEAPAAAPVLRSPRPAANALAREQAQRKLNRHVFYPPEAVERGLEGEVKLRLLLDASGRVVEAAVLAGSGHALLDRAALDAARQIGRVDAGGARELLLPVVFRLE